MIAFRPFFRFVPRRPSVPQKLSGSLVVVIASAALTSLIGVSPIRAESWTDLRGTRTIEARMIGVWGDSIVLQRKDGRRLTIKVSNLRSDSRIQAGKLSKNLRSERLSRSEELKNQNAASAAGAPDPLPTPSAAPPYQPPPKEVTIDAFLSQVDQSISDGHLVVLYDSLPPSYRSDVDELVRLAVEKVDPDSFANLIAGIQQISGTVVTKQNWLLSSPRVKSLYGTTLDDLQGPLLSIAMMVHATIGTDAFQLEKLKTQPFGKWLAQIDTTTAPYLYQIQKMSSDSSRRNVAVKKADHESAEVTLELNGKETQHAFKKVEGYWVPQGMNAEAWKKTVEEMKTTIAETDSDVLLDPLGMMVTSITGMMKPMIQAASANDYHVGMESVILPATETLTLVAELIGIDWTPGSNDRSNTPEFAGGFPGGGDPGAAEAARQQEEAMQRMQEEEERMRSGM